MSKPSGISRNRRKAKCIENNLKVEQKLNKKKSLNDVFKGFDFSDTSINLNSIDNNFSFKSTKSVLFDKNEENKDINDSDIDSNNSKSFKCLTKSFTHINQSIDKIETNVVNNSIDININRNSFQSLNKSSIVRNEDNNEDNTEDNNANNSKPNVNKRKSFREVFEDIDLSDFKCDFNNINISFQSSRKAIKLTNDCIESHEKHSVEDKNDSNNENLDQFSNDMSELKVSSNSSPKVDNAFDATDYSFNTQENDSFLSFAKDFEENSSQTKNTVNESEVNNENNLVNEEIKDEDSDDEKSVSFILRSDYCTFGEKKFDKNEFDSNFEFECFQNNDFMGFRTGSGFQINIEENDKIKALKIFQDIEICLQREINSIKLNNSMSSLINVNNTIDSGEEKTQLNTNKEIVSNSNLLNNSNEENLLNKNLESNHINLESNEFQTKETMSSKAVMSLITSPSDCTYDRFKPLKCYPLKQSNRDRILSNSSLFENSIKESMIPCTSTPKSRLIHQKPIFEPKKSLLFADNSDDL
jgi:hypothetical protein